MKIRICRWATAPVLCGLLLIGVTSSAVGATQSSSSGRQPPGWEAAKTISLATGVAISPLLGVGAVGAYEYWRAPREQRAKLSWYAQPWFFVPALLLVGIVALKDALGTVAPTALKKPFDVAEAIENKISGLIAVGAFIPLIVSIFPQTPGAGSFVPGADVTGLGFAAISGSSLGNALLTPFVMLAFIFVWLASHAINMLILLSPFTIVDSALKAFRLAVLGLLTGASFANPYLGAAIGLVIIVVSYFIAGWSFRLTVFGTVYVWDFVTLRRTRFQPGAESNRMFTARKMEGAPVRTYGRLGHLDSGRLRFDYRPWLVLKQRSYELPPGSLVVGRGLFYPEIDRVTEGKLTALFILPPRYMTHEEAVARVYGFDGVRDIGLLKGMKAMWNWLRNLVAGRPKQEVAVSAQAV
jgi:hypothetical protein